MKPQNQYEQDFYGWVMANASLLRAGKYQEADMNHIIEELEEMGISNKHAFISRLAQLIFHLLKWEYQPDFRGRSWEGSIEHQREEIEYLLTESPSLQSKLKECLPVAYKKAKSLIKGETPIDLKLLSNECPYTFKQLIDETFFPDGDNHANNRTDRMANRAREGDYGED
jgi:Domain of unknown function DUF29